MNASASIPLARIPTGVARTFIVALLAAFLLGGTGGYLFHGWSSSQSTTTTTDTTTHPFVNAPVPYTSPVPSAVPQPPLDPAGFPIPI